MKEDEIHFLKNHRIPYLQVVAGQSVRNVFPLHTHSTVNIGTIAKGRAQFLYNGQERIIKSGDVYFVPSQEAHSLAALDDRGFSHTVLCVRQSDFYEALNLDTFQKIKISNPTAADTNLSKKINAFASLADNSKTPHVELETQLWDTIKEATRICGIDVVVPQIAKTQAAESIGAVCEYIDSNPEQTLKELAAHARISLFHFAHVFKDVTGLSPYAYCIQARIKSACRMLLERKPIVDTALALGFSDQSHFTRFFKKHTGVSPRQYVLNNKLVS